MSRRKSKCEPLNDPPKYLLRKRDVTVIFDEGGDLALCDTLRQNGKENVRRKRSATCSAPPSQPRRHSLRQVNEDFANDHDDGKLMKIDEDEVLPDEFREKLSRPSALLEDNDGLAQAGFQTPKKRKSSMVLKAQESASKHSSPLKVAESGTPSRRVSLGGIIGATPSRGDNTPTKGVLKKTSSGVGTPKSRKSLVLNDVSPVCQEKSGIAYDKTPRHMRSRTLALVQKHLSELENDDDGDFSSDEEDAFEPDDDSSEASESSPDEEEAVFSKHQQKQQSIKEDLDYDAYFETQSLKQITSNNTLSRLRNPRLEKDMLQKLLADEDTSHRDLISQISKNYRMLAHNFLFSLWEGFSILLYGVGSKRHLLQSLREDILSNCQVLLVNGFFPDVTIKQVLEEILSGILEVKDVPSNLLECVDLIESIQLKKSSERIYLLINNIDGAAFRNDRAQAIFSHLAQLPKIHLIASVDHINAPLLWDQSKLRRFNFIWWDVTTFVAYTAETSYESSLLIQESGVSLASLHSVFKSLIPNAKKVFLMIARNQLTHAKDKSFSGISFQELYWKCRASFLASSDKVLRAQLTEFLDHELLKTRRGVDGVETLLIPIKNGVLSEFIESQEQEAAT